MGWRGTLRSLQAAARQAEREAERRNREWAKEEKLALRIAELESAEEEYLEYVKEVEDLITVHTECSPRSNWEAFRTASPPGVPIRKDNRESLARQHLEEYRPGLKDKILRREETTRKRLEQAVDEGRTLDDKKFEEALRDYEKQKRDFDRRKTIAEGIDEGDVAAFIDAIKEVDSLSKIGGLGSSVSFRFAKWYVEATVRVHSEDRVPSKEKRLLSSGKISVIGVCTSLPTTPYLVVGWCACRVRVGPSLNRWWGQRPRLVAQAGRRAFPGDGSVVD